MPGLIILLRYNCTIFKMIVRVSQTVSTGNDDAELNKVIIEKTLRKKAENNIY